MELQILATELFHEAAILSRKARRIESENSGYRWQCPNLELIDHSLDIWTYLYLLDENFVSSL